MTPPGSGSKKKKKSAVVTPLGSGSKIFRGRDPAGAGVKNIFRGQDPGGVGVKKIFRGHDPAGVDPDPGKTLVYIIYMYIYI